MGIQAIADQIRPKVESSGFEQSVKFDTGSDGVLVIDGETVSTTDAPTDCTIKLSLEDLEGLISGDLSPTTAFMTGKLKVEGDMSVAFSPWHLATRASDATQNCSDAELVAIATRDSCGPATQVPQANWRRGFIATHLALATQSDAREGTQFT